ncbi:MAG TPA: DMT family transporter [Candidatus Blautia merdavium]|uniref:DMT family transporter n=1 Tax=Candidatus Blautia merdavium TaxID=2838494 RepID=A0A9D2PRK0_9FIRM|nr:DMT family transporter [Candidatus Blautia merdavium]
MNIGVPAAGIELAIKPCSITPAAITSCLYLGIAGTAIAHTFWNKSIKILNASTCSMWYPLQPLVSALLGIVLLGEALTPQFLTGGILICAGILITVAVKPERK